MERAIVLAAGADVLLPQHVPFDRARRVESKPQHSYDPLADRTTQKEQERARVIDALRQANGNQGKAADLLGISRRTLINRLDEYQIPRPRKP
jgi:transcriptional regulator with PAS, ATPase and Fis domain